MKRKEIVTKLNEHFGVKAVYLGAPSFAYELLADGFRYNILRDGKITRNDCEIFLDEILNSKCELNANEDNEVILSMREHSGKTLLNFINMISSKQSLIIKSLGMKSAIMMGTFAQEMNEHQIETIPDFEKAIKIVGETKCFGIEFDFVSRKTKMKIFCENLSGEKFKAFKELIESINEYAKKQKRASYKRCKEDNPKYIFRTWLIRLGMNGPQYKESRKILMENLPGNAAFRNGNIN